MFFVSLFVAFLTVPALYRMSVHEAIYFTLQSPCMEVSVSLSCLFVHAPPYQTIVVCCNPVFRHGSLHTDQDVVLHVRVGLP